MPTPSSNEPRDPTSPPPYSFSSCPDDMQHPSPPLQDSDDETRSGANSTAERRSPTPDDAPTGDSDSQPSLTAGREDSLFVDDRVSVEPSSRATTVSPQPHSIPDGRTSPGVQSGHGLESLKPRTLEKTRRASSNTSAQSHSLIPSSSEPRASEMESVDDDFGDGDVHSSSYMGLDYTNRRSIPLCPSSYLRPGSKFHGTQQSERQVYDVQVEIKHVDMRESFLCGYLRIQGLTEDHPTLTTYFEGEIIGTKYNFITQHEGWGATAKVDLNHWAKFGAFRPYQKQARKGTVTIPDVTQMENIFMRWKEHFLVPDHRVRTITGASFEGFYYICFNQVRGEVSGIYFHSKSEKFQQLELKHVQDRGCFTAMEFR